MTIREELLALKRKDGLIVAEDGVRWAKSHKDSALHRALEWNNTKASHNWRVWQIRQMIGIYIVSDTGRRTVVSLSIDRGKSGGGYRTIDDVLPHANLRETMLNDALAELDRVQHKYDHLNELASVWVAKENVRSRKK